MRTLSIKKTEEEVSKILTEAKQICLMLKEQIKDEDKDENCTGKKDLHSCRTDGCSGDY